MLTQCTSEVISTIINHFHVHRPMSPLEGATPGVSRNCNGPSTTNKSDTLPKRRSKMWCNSKMWGMQMRPELIKERQRDKSGTNKRVCLKLAGKSSRHHWRFCFFCFSRSSDP